jgi:hypothetical protein
MASILRSLLLGLADGLQFNPLAAVLGSAVAAAFVGSTKRRHHRLWVTFLAVGLAWCVGDGTRVIFAAAGRAGASTGWPAFAMWAVAGLAVGYVLPTLAGAYVGRHVTHGTGWLSAIAVAAMVAGALSWIAPTLARAVETLALRL